MQTALPLTGWAGGREMPAQFSFVDLFAGIGGMRLGFEAIGGQCIFTCEWNKHSQQTHRANFGDEEFQDAQEYLPDEHPRDRKTWVDSF